MQNWKNCSIINKRWMIEDVVNPILTYKLIKYAIQVCDILYQLDIYFCGFSYLNLLINGNLWCTLHKNWHFHKKSSIFLARFFMSWKTAHYYCSYEYEYILKILFTLAAKYYCKNILAKTFTGIITHDTMYEVLCNTRNPIIDRNCGQTL